MRSISEIDTWSKDELRHEHAERLRMLGQLVGQLYPSIVLGEMARIEAHSDGRCECRSEALPVRKIVT